MKIKTTIAAAVAAGILAAPALAAPPQCDTHTYQGAVCAVRAALPVFYPLGEWPAKYGDQSQPVRCYYAGKRRVLDTHGRMADSHSKWVVQVYPRWSCHARFGRFVVVQATGEVTMVWYFKAG